MLTQGDRWGRRFGWGVTRRLGVALSVGALGLGGLSAASLGSGAGTGAAIDPAYSGCQTLGIAGAFNLFAGGGFTAQSGDIVGTLAAGGNVTVSSFRVDSGNDPAVDGATLVAGGNLTFKRGSIAGNHVADYRGTRDESGVAPGKFQKVGAGKPFSFSTALGHIDQVSSSLAALPQPSFDTVGSAPGGALALTEGPGGRSPNVFDLSASQLQDAAGVVITVTPGSTVVVNVSGSTVSFDHLAYVSVNGSQAANAGETVLWNFPDARSISYARGLNWLGSILAPKADLTLGSGEYHGNVIVGGSAAYSQGSEVHDQLFDGCLPLPKRTSTVPVGAVGGATLAGMLGVVGGSLLLVDRRRRRRAVGASTGPVA
ncbi:choice-of-anchor A family protein [Aciditerrimonas ferrireducens]|uniref:choice-of-anchor A family protein n=1 Tax=Aciditerrimonas ferrireducens TaxID=667306 RepID=UPI0020034209|nr:choice-of-anchor A family protein [Aciditerrimonas ferrireducens]MCK4178025.1 choice-of-anchor A family protein [Aciditerrimonas ferrireducens]